MRVLPAVLLLLFAASPAASFTYDDLYWLILHANDRASSHARLSLGSAGPDAPAEPPSFYDEPDLPDPEYVPPYEGPAIPLDPTALDDDGSGSGLDEGDLGDEMVADLEGDEGGHATSPIPEPTAALLFTAGALLVAGRVGSGRRKR